MKKKLTIGVFLALAVVLVASIVGVGVADAEKPNKTSNVEIQSINATHITYDYAWDNIGAWGVQVDVHQLALGGGYLATSNREIHIFDKRTKSGVLLSQSIAHKRVCGFGYTVVVFPLKKNDTPIRGVQDADGISYPCP